MSDSETLLDGATSQSSVCVADYDPDLFAELGEDRSRAQEHAVARRINLDRGPWTASEAGGAIAEVREQRGSLGLLVLEGLLWRETCIGKDAGIELLGPGDLLRPWVQPIPESEILAEGQWTVLERSSVAVLDRRFALAVARWPVITAVLMDRLILRARWLSFQLAICHIRNLRQRVLLAMWHFGDRWGRMAPTGVIVPVRLPHRMLAQLVGARRPSVTTALKHLKEEGLLVEREDGTWLLTGEAPEDLRKAYEQASSSLSMSGSSLT